jgi:hypothetical protein
VTGQRGGKTLLLGGLFGRDIAGVPASGLRPSSRLSANGQRVPVVGYALGRFPPVIPFSARE